MAKIKATILSIKDQAALLEWYSGQSVRRATFPLSSLDLLPEEDNAIRSCDLDEELENAGIPFGLPWADLLRITRSRSYHHPARYRECISLRRNLDRRPVLRNANPSARRPYVAHFIHPERRSDRREIVPE